MTNLIDVTPETFSEVVLEGSHQGYVIVDFWAPWCNPCKILKPMLERLAGEYGYTLAKVNTEEHQQLGAEYGVRGIPDVRIYRDGAEVDRFSGALPEAEIRSIIERHMPSATGERLLELSELMGSGDTGLALDGYQQLLTEDPENAAIKIEAARAMLEVDQTDKAVELLHTIKMGNDHYQQAHALLAMTGLQSSCASRDQYDLESIEHIYASAACAAVQSEYEEALAGFLKVIQKSAQYNEGAARKAMLSLFELLGSDDPLVKKYQRKLALYIL